MPRHAMWWCAAVLGAAVLLTSCERQDIDVNALTQSYSERIAKMPHPVVPRLVRGTGANPSSTTQLQVTGLEPRAPGGIVKLSLQDALHRAMANSLDIKVESFSPGIAAQDVITADAVFDAVFFMDAQFANLDQPVNINNVGGGQSQTREIDAGIKKHLITGTDIQMKYKTDWQWSNAAFQRLNPHYNADAQFQLTQPLLQGFGTDVNKAQIRVNKNKADQSVYQFQAKVIDTLAKVEQAYWKLYFTRQVLAIFQEHLGRAERYYALVVQRLVLDAHQGEVNQAKVSMERPRTQVYRFIADVKDAEDQLKNLLNDPALPLTADIAILPTDEPMTEELDLDPQQALWAGLENRSELQAARLDISNANIARTVAQNERLPKLNAVVQWDLLGLREKWRPTNDQIAGGDFNNITVGLNYEYQLGGRAGGAAEAKAALQQEQTATQYHLEVDGVMTQIQTALRDVQTCYLEMKGYREVARASEKIPPIIIARREKLDFTQIDLESRTMLQVAQDRQTLVDAVTRYNLAIVKLEQAKGTLLQYDRVELAPIK